MFRYYKEEIRDCELVHVNDVGHWTVRWMDGDDQYLRNHPREHITEVLVPAPEALEVGMKVKCL